MVRCHRPIPEPKPTHAAPAAPATVIEAWGRRNLAEAKWEALPLSENGNETLEEQACADEMKITEEAIRSAIASNPRDIAIQLWTALFTFSEFGTRAMHSAIASRDLDLLTRLEGGEPGLSSKVRLILAALRSLKAMEAPQ